ncbi:MAG: hypothetical protein HC815_05635 [Richelia sp. RM1_1_1]|nr:hypothetical protein [Richelia sp. RM1_1_1]
MSVEQAYYVYKETVKDLGESRVNLLAKIQQARFQQHPDLLEKVKENGGVEWLKECTYKIGGKNDFWEGKGEESPYIRSLIKGYENAIQIDKNNQEVNIPPLETTTETQIIPTKESLSTQEKTSLESNLESKNQKDQIPAFGTMDSIVEKARNNTLEMLSSWQEIARKIGKNEKYLNQINEAIETYKTEVIGIENSFLAMANDIKELEKINDVTRMVQRVASTIGRMDNNVLSAKTTSGYQFVIASSDKNLLVYDKPVNGKNILLYIKEGQVKTNKINDNFIKDLRMMNFTIDNALSNVKNQLVV